MTTAVDLVSQYESAVASYCNLDPLHKVNVRFRAIGRAPVLKQQVYKVSSSERFESITSFLRRQIGVKADEELFLYVNNSFTPAPDEIILNLYKCFKVDDHLVISYSHQPPSGDYWLGHLDLSQSASTDMLIG